MYLDLAFNQIRFPPGKGINRRNEIIILELQELFRTFRSFCCTDDINQYSFIIIFPLLKSVNTNLIFPSRKDNQLFITENTFPEEMATLRNKRKMAALNKENCEKHPRSNLAENSSVPRSQEDYITQVSEKIEGKVTKKL